jgi:hypothetical protein
MKVGELLADLLGKAGVDTTSEVLKSVLAIGIDLDDDVSSQVQKNLFNFEVAKSNKDLKHHFVSPFAQGVDQDMKELLEAAGRQDILDSIKDVKSTGERARKIITELAKVKPATGEKGSKEWEETTKAQKAQIDKLLSDLSAKDNVFAEEKKNLLNQFDQERVNEAVMGKFNSLAWSDSIPEVVRKDVAKKLLDSALAEKKAIVKKDENGNIQLLSVDTNSSVIDEKNNIVTLDGLITNIMTQHKLIKVNDNPVGGGTSPIVTRVSLPQGGGTQRSNRNVESSIDRALNDQLQS